MQQLTASPRDGLTAAQVSSLLTADAVEVSAGLELLDTTDTVVSDISDSLAGGEVSRSNYAAVHGTCRLQVEQALQWGRDRVRPYMVLSSGGVSARFNLGVFVLTTPDSQLGDSVVVYDVTGYDKLYLLQSPVGDTYTVAAGASYLQAVKDAIAAAGAGSNVNLDSTKSGATLPAAMVWPLSSEKQATWLQVVNDLLAAVGYRGVWCDQDGYFRSEPYLAPVNRAVEWTFDLSSAANVVAEDRKVTADVWATPNWWRFIRNGLTTAPAEGSGQYTVINQSSGITSIDSRGRTVRKVVFLDAADQASLVTQGDRIVTQDKQVSATVAFSTGPFPIAGHFDVATYADAANGGSWKVQAREWRQPLDGGDVSWTWERVDG